MKRRSLMLIAIVLFLLWNLFTYLLLASRQPDKDADEKKQLWQLKFDDFRVELQRQVADHEEILQVLNEAKRNQMLRKTTPERSIHGHGPVLGSDPNVQLVVVVMACDRLSVTRNLDQLIKYRPSPEKFPIIVSQDCGHEPTANVIASYRDQVTHIQQPDLSDIALSKKEEKFKGYYKIARHYKWALGQVFHRFNYTAAIIVEDDLDISPDFYEYFSATYSLLTADPTLWCVSAWNDNGKMGLISEDAELLYRSDFFPGLGWMLEKKTWLELEDKWPKTFWDDWMRHTNQRHDRACIRPEIPRTSTFGRQGVSRGQYFDKHLKFIRHNEKFVPFTKRDLSYLLKDNYDRTFLKAVYDSPLVSSDELMRNTRSDQPAVRIQYDNKDDFKLKAKMLGIMEDLKAGVPRSGYRGIVSFVFRGQRVYMSPPANWTTYDTELWS